MRILFARVEDVLDVYHRDFAADEVLVCMDETSRQHIQETRLPLPARPGEMERFDYEYTRAGVSNLFMLSAPLEGWRQVLGRSSVMPKLFRSTGALRLKMPA